MKSLVPPLRGSAAVSATDSGNHTIPQFPNSSIPESDARGSQKTKTSYARKFVVRCIGIFSIVLCVVSCGAKSYRMQRAERLYRQGQIYLSKGDHQQAMKKFENSLALAELADFKAGIAHNLNEMAIVDTIRGEFDGARTRLERSLAIYRELAMAPEISKSLNNIALTYVKERRFDMAIIKYEELIAWDQQTDNRLGLGLTLYNEGIIFQEHLGQFRKSQERYREALDVFKELGDQQYIDLVEKRLVAE